MRVDGSRTNYQKIGGNDVTSLSEAAGAQSENPIQMDSNRSGSKELFDGKKVKWVNWVMDKFKTYKSPGYMAMLQKYKLLPTLALLIGASYLLGYLPKA
jgi:hypothetical protein